MKRASGKEREGPPKEFSAQECPKIGTCAKGESSGEWKKSRSGGRSENVGVIILVVNYHQHHQLPWHPCQRSGLFKPGKPLACFPTYLFALLAGK